MNFVHLITLIRIESSHSNFVHSLYLQILHSLEFIENKLQYIYIVRRHLYTHVKLQIQKGSSLFCTVVEFLKKYNFWPQIIFGRFFD